VHSCCLCAASASEMHWISVCTFIYVRFWVVKIEKKKSTILFWGICIWMCFSSHQCFFRAWAQMVRGPLELVHLLLFHRMLLFYYLVPRITVDIVCLLSSAHTVLELELNDVLRPVYIYLYRASQFHSSNTTHYVWVSQKALSWPEYTESKHLGYKLRTTLSVAWENDGEMLFCRTTIVEVTLMSAGKRLKPKQHDTFTPFSLTCRFTLIHCQVCMYFFL